MPKSLIFPPIISQELPGFPSWRDKIICATISVIPFTELTKDSLHVMMDTSNPNGYLRFQRRGVDERDAKVNNAKPKQAIHERRGRQINFSIQKSNINTMTTNFYFGNDSASTTSASDDDAPFTQGLPRSDFLAEDFSAAEYLSKLADDHQTLEDLREDLSERSQALSKELLDLVNDNYEQFLSLGSDLKGGDERVEDVRVGLLGLKRGFEEVKHQVTVRRQKTDELLDEKKSIGKQIAAGRMMLELDARLEELEEKLMMASLNQNAEDEWSGSEDDEDEFEEISAEDARARELQRLIRDYRHVLRVADAAEECPFVKAQEQRMDRVRNTLLLDLATELKKACGSDEVSRARMVKVLGIYRDMGENAEAVKALKDLKS